MTTPADDGLDPAEVAHFLQTRPDFFQTHASLFADLRVPHPHEARAISLGERQILTLRARAKELERQLAHLLHQAARNEQIQSQLTDWAAPLLAEPDATALPEAVCQGLAATFELPRVVLRLWQAALPADHPCAEPLPTAAQQAAATLTQPWCGLPGNHPAAAWLAPAPGSVALVPVCRPGESAPFGLLMLCADDPERYTADMGTAFLDVVARLAGATLARLPAA